jgi:hypothetical protein
VWLLQESVKYKVFICSVRRLLVKANVLLSSPIHVTLMMEAIIFSETSVLIRATRRNIPEDDVLHVTFQYRNDGRTDGRMDGRSESFNGEPRLMPRRTNERSLTPAVWRIRM